MMNSVDVNEKEETMYTRFIIRCILLMGVGAFLFQAVKAMTTGFWLDEAWISGPIHSYLTGHGWQLRSSPPDMTFEGIYFSSEITTGPSVLVPGLLISMLFGRIVPPALHLFVLGHILLFYVTLRVLQARNVLVILSIWLVVIALTPMVYATHFLGQLPGAAWAVVGIALLCSEAESQPGNHNRLFVAGMCFGFSILAKLVLAISVIPALCIVWIRKRYSIRVAFWTVLGCMLPILIWHLYQLCHAGGWQSYLSIQASFLDFATDDDYGALGFLKGRKPVSFILSDCIKFLHAGPAFILVFVYLILAPLGFKCYEGSRRIHEWVLVSWWVGLLGFFWWVGVSNYELIGGGAHTPHAAAFVCIVLLPASFMLTRLVLGLSQRFDRESSMLAKTIPIILAMSAVIFFFTIRILDYGLHRKGYGPYSSLAMLARKSYGPYTDWASQKMLAQWIDRFGTKDRLLPIFNCDDFLEDEWLENNILSAQKVLSSGMYRSFPCREDIIEKETRRRPVAAFSRSMSSFPELKSLKLLEGKGGGQGLWGRTGE